MPLTISANITCIQTGNKKIHKYRPTIMCVFVTVGCVRAVKFESDYG